MKIAYKLTADEFLEGQRVFNRDLASGFLRFNYRFATPVGVLLTADGVVLVALRLQVIIGLFLTVWGIWMIANRTIFWPRRMRKEYVQYPDMDRSMEFGNEVVAAETNYGNSKFLWGRLTRFVETEKLFVLFAPPRFLYTVPKRAFSAAELEDFRHLIQQKIPVSESRPIHPGL
jgi:hypothetical protein